MKPADPGRVVPIVQLCGLDARIYVAAGGQTWIPRDLIRKVCNEHHLSRSDVASGLLWLVKKGILLRGKFNQVRVNRSIRVETV